MSHPNSSKKPQADSHTFSHSHSHTKDMSSERIGWAFFLNFCFTIIEFIGGWLTNSTAIMSDAVHDLGDTLSIGSAWVLNRLGKKQANDEFSYGFRRLSLFGALLNGLVLTIGSVWIMAEAIPRLFNPIMPEAEGMLLLAIFGVCVNGFAAYKLSSGETLNERVLNWHLLEDVLGWVAVLIVSIVLMFADVPILDPLLSIAFTFFILINVARNLWATVKLFAQSSPDENLSNRVKQSLMDLKFVDNFHHFHLWSLDGESHVLTVHLDLGQRLNIEQQEDLKLNIKHQLAEFKLAHTTIELEWPNEHCRDA